MLKADRIQNNRKGETSKFRVGDRTRVKDRPGWPGGYKIAHWEGVVVEIEEDPAGYVIVKVDKTGYNMAFPENELDKVLHAELKKEKQ